MKSCNDHSNDDENKEKESCNYSHDPNYLSRKRQISTSSFDMEQERGLNPAPIENTKEINQLKIPKKPRHTFSSACNHHFNEASGKVRSGKRLNELQVNESKMKAGTQNVAKRIHDETNNTQHKLTNCDDKIKVITRDPHSVVASGDKSHPITSISSYNDIKPHSDEIRTLEDAIRHNKTLQHHINTLGGHHTSPYLEIEVGEHLPLMSSSEMCPDVRRDFQSTTLPLDHVSLNSMNPFSSSLLPTPSTNVLLNNLTRSSDHLLLLSTMQNISRLTAVEGFASNPFAHHLLAQDMMPTPSMSRISLPFGSPFRHTYGPPCPETLALLNANQPSIIQFWLERINNSHRIPIPHSIVANEESHSNLIPTQVLRFNDTIDSVAVSNRTRQNSNSSESVSFATLRTLQHLFGTESIGAGVPQCLPFVVALPDDTRKLSSLQVLLRQQIEFFSASEDDLLSHARGRNKPISLKQVGIRCKHCASLTMNCRKKGSMYFPFTLLGIYQAAQNMASTHFLQENDNENHSQVKLMMIQCMRRKSMLGSGKEFWSDAARNVGLLDTTLGIRFIRDLVAGSEGTHLECILR